MNFTEAVFLIQFAIVVLIALGKLLNVSRKGEMWGWEISTVMLIGFAFTWGVGFITTIYSVNALYSTLFTLESWVLPFVIILFFAEVIFNIKINPRTQPYYSNRN